MEVRTPIKSLRLEFVQRLYFPHSVWIFYLSLARREVKTVISWLIVIRKLICSVIYKLACGNPYIIEYLQRGYCLFLFCCQIIDNSLSEYAAARQYHQMRSFPPRSQSILRKARAYTKCLSLCSSDKIIITLTLTICPMKSISCHHHQFLCC